MESSESSEGVDVRNSEGLMIKLEEEDKDIVNSRSKTPYKISSREVWNEMIYLRSVLFYYKWIFSILILLQLMHLAKGNTDKYWRSSHFRPQSSYS